MPKSLVVFESSSSPIKRDEEYRNPQADKKQYSIIATAPMKPSFRVAVRSDGSSRVITVTSAETRAVAATIQVQRHFINIDTLGQISPTGLH
jgi:hypothetical protein